MPRALCDIYIYCSICYFKIYLHALRNPWKNVIKEKKTAQGEEVNLRYSKVDFQS